MKVTLLKPHTHAGVSYQPGDSIDVDPSVVAFLLEHAVIAPETTPATPNDPKTVAKPNTKTEPKAESKTTEGAQS